MTDVADALVQEDAQYEEGDAQSAEQPKEKPQQKTVPLAALEAERTKRQQLEESLQETRTRLDELSNLRDELAQWKESQKASIDYWEAPKGYIDNLAEQSRGSIQDVARRQEELERKLTYQEQVNGLRTFMNGQQDMFRANNQDYDDAYRYVRNIQKNNLKLAGIEDKDINAALEQNEIQLAATLIGNGLDYADYVYKMAENMGYKRDIPTKENNKLDKIEKGAKKNPNATTGKLGELEGMPKDEFEAAMNEVFGFLKR